MRHLIISIIMIVPLMAQNNYTIEWVDTVNLSGIDNSHGIAVKGDRVYTVGYFGDIWTNLDICLIEYNTSGSLLRIDTLNIGRYDYGTDVAVDNSGNIYVAGVLAQGTNYNYGIIKLDANLNILWIDTIPNGVDPWFQCHLALDANGNIYAAGNIRAKGLDIFVTKISPDGSTIWTRNFDYGYDDDIMAIVYSNTGYVYIAGKSNNGSNDDIFVGKVSTSDGHMQWYKTIDYGGDDQAWGIAVDNDGVPYVAGFVHQNNLKNIFIAKLDPTNSAVLWATTYNGGRNDWANGIVVDDSGKLFITGGSENPNNADLIVLEYTNNGTLVWADTIDNGHGDSGHDIAIDPQGNLYITGVTNLADRDILNLKYKKLQTDVDENNNVSPYFLNPSWSMGKLTISFNLPSNSTVYVINASGQVLKKRFVSGNGTLTFRNLAAGVYGIYVTGKTYRNFKKVVAVR